MFRNLLYKLTTACAVTAACVSWTASRSNADELIVSFVAELTPSTWSGPASISPFNPTSQLGFGVGLNPDLIQADGQFIVKDFDPTFTGTYSFSPGGTSNPDVEFFLHTPPLERVKAFKARIGTMTAAMDVLRDRFGYVTLSSYIPARLPASQSVSTRSTGMSDNSTLWLSSVDCVYICIREYCAG